MTDLYDGGSEHPTESDLVLPLPGPVRPGPGRDVGL